MGLVIFLFALLLHLLPYRIWASRLNTKLGRFSAREAGLWHRRTRVTWVVTDRWSFGPQDRLRFSIRLIVIYVFLLTTFTLPPLRVKMYSLYTRDRLPPWCCFWYQLRLTTFCEMLYNCCSVSYGYDAVYCVPSAVAGSVLHEHFCSNLMFFWPCIMIWLYTDYQLDAPIIIYS